jgi:4-amino-4-deoxy-L-arabinose transferase-like glycosyltransferase
MSVLEGVTADRRKLVAAVIVILAVAAFVRFYHMQWSFSNNGIDEGVMLERSLMVSRGYHLYTELPCDQAPLGFYIGAVFGGDVISLRTLDGALSLLAIASCMEAARRIRGNAAMLITGILLTADFAVLRESRLYSLDGISSFFLAFSILFFTVYLQRGSRMALVGSGAMIGLSTTTKLFGVFGLLGMVIFMVLEMRREKARRAQRALETLMLIIVAAIPMMIFLLFLGPSDMLQGMVFNQGRRSFDLFLKLSIPLYFGLNLAYTLPLVYARSTWRTRPEVRFLLVTSFVVLAFMIFQPLVLFHHMVLLSPALAILAGVFVAENLEHKKGLSQSEATRPSSKNSPGTAWAVLAVLVVGMVVSAGLAAYGVGLQNRPWQNVYGDRIEEITGRNDWVISGDPLVTAFADRQTPPNMVNLAYRLYPDFSVDDVEAAILDYNVSVVILCYRLDEFAQLPSFLADHNYSLMTAGWIGHGARSVLDMPSDPYGPVSFFVRDDIVAAFHLPTTGFRAQLTSAS